MIVNLTQNGWEVIYHRAHALLAAQLAGQWDKTQTPKRFFETLAAISHHDDLEVEWENAQLTEAGAPLDFTLTLDYSAKRIEKLADLVDKALHRGRWVALLVSMHVCFLSQAQWESSEQWKQFLNDQVQKQQAWRDALGIDKDEAEQTYQFLQWCDRLSLILCQKSLPVDQRALEITSRFNHQRYDVKQIDGFVHVVPWPFEKDEFIVGVDACDLNQLKFEDNAQLKQALQQAPIKELTWKFAKLRT
ncbi:conserved hypothetical protein [Gloeothece citriformis PCC 7424]|uniref:DUF3891 domain-containing protein n=1 Tax=Gloeothece citriformis (strain PCC 7424) TaxID=65393 RepID=B7K8J0_GLOC7|nr:DUF3891 family protein [Gloeothece citriformis]ACK71188.1 conserved hypothetical protein [Gloeothece citriformis PCC 7424]